MITYLRFGMMIWSFHVLSFVTVDLVFGQAKPELPTANVAGRI